MTSGVSPFAIRAGMNGRQVLSGLGWSATATAVSAACQLLLVAVLARLLDPATFGLMALAVVVLRFAGFFALMGVGQAIVQQPSVEAEDCTAALLLTAFVSLALYAALALAAPLFAAVFRSPELTSLIRALGLSLVLSAVGSLPMSLLRRQARFKRVSGIELSSFVLGYGAVAVVCAFCGLGVWSLVFASLGQQASMMVLGLHAVRYPVTWPVSRSAWSRLWASGSRYSLLGLLEFLFAQVESLLIGRVFGKVDLGLFNRAVALSNLPVEVAVNAVSKVMFPAMSAMQHDRGRLSDGFQMLLLGTGLFSSALACGLAAAAPDVVALVLGPRWLDCAHIVAIVAFSVPPMFMYVVCGITLDTVAAFAPKLRLQSLMLLLKIGLVLLLARWGLSGVATAVVLAESARLALGLRLAARQLGIDAACLWRQVALFATAGVAVWVAVGGALSLGTAAGMSLPGRISVEILAGAAVSTLGVLLLAVRYPGYAPLQRFESMSRWRDGMLEALRLQTQRP